jgi:hypothetical protein
MLRAEREGKGGKKMESNLVYMEDGRIANYDEQAGIHYGVIPVSEVQLTWDDSAEPMYADPKEGEEGEEDDEDEGPIISFAYEQDGYVLVQWADDSDIFVMKSPYYTFAAPCSPYAPNAGHLLYEGHLKTYCLGHDWFPDDGVAPYKVYSVETGKKVLP